MRTAHCLRGIAQIAVVFSTIAFWGQNATFVTITPRSATMVVGDSQPFRLIDQDGRKQHDVSWSVSDPAALQALNGDEFTVIAKKTGDFYVWAHSSAGDFEATIKVLEGNSIPYGSARWSGPQHGGCKVQKITPAFPSASGVDVFVTVQCKMDNTWRLTGPMAFRYGAKNLAATPVQVQGPAQSQPSQQYRIPLPRAV